MSNQYIDDLYNYCCLKTSTANPPKPIKSQYKNIFNNILIKINEIYEERIKKNAIRGLNYALLYKGQIPEIIIPELWRYLSTHFKKFNIMIINNTQCMFDTLFLDYDIYNIFIVWNNSAKQIRDISTNTDKTETFNQYLVENTSADSFEETLINNKNLNDDFDFELINNDI
jgi:hypothetical protein